MFQTAWYDKGCYNRIPGITEKVPDTFIKKEQIEFVRTLYWDEHCLECSAPACYSSCPKYIARKDKLCKRMHYGIKTDKPTNGFLWNATVKFREWGKLEALINEGTLTPKEIKKLNGKDSFVTCCVKAVSSILAHSDYRYSGIFDGLKRKKYANLPSKALFVNDFLFQCYSHTSSPYQMNFEIADKDNIVIYKKGIQIKHGFNQEIIKLDFTPPKGGLVRFFPENNIEAEITLFAADFVKLKGAIPSKPNKKIKCIAWDLDNTVWNGILAEANPDELCLRDGVLNTVKELDKRGVIQIVVSKNDVGAAEPVLERLGIKEYFVYVLSNWNSKSVNIYNASRMLNINVDTFGLIDDSDFERLEVSKTLPCVRVYSENLNELFENKELDIEITSESANRRMSYINEAQRKQVLSNVYSGNNTDFIKACGIEITVKAIETDEEKKRSFELLQRTNQLNLSGNKYSREEFENILNDGNNSVIVFVKDKYGDYGQVAFVHFEVNDKITVFELAMSCRVASKYVEAAFTEQLRKQYKKDVLMCGKRTERNGTLYDVFDKCGFELISDDGKNISMELKFGAKIPYSEINKTVWKN